MQPLPKSVAGTAIATLAAPTIGAVSLASEVPDRLQRLNPKVQSYPRILRGIFDHGSQDQGSQIDEFEVLNGLLETMVLGLPDTVMNKDLPTPLSSVDIAITDLQCSGFYLHDMNMNHDRPSEKEITLDFNVEVDLTCSFYWKYSYDAGFLGDIDSEGGGEILAENNNLGTILSFTSPNFDSLGPVKGDIDACAAAINVVDMNFEGSVSAAIANVFEFAVRNTVEREIQEVLCDELSALGDILSTLLLDVKLRIDPFLPEGNPYADASKSIAIMLSAGEDLLEAARNDGVDLFDFTSTDGMVSAGINAALDEGNKLLGMRENGDLNINEFLRSHLLADDGSLTIPLDADPIFVDNNFPSKIPILEEVEVEMESFRLIGLDSFTEMEALTVVAPQMVESRLALDELKIEIEVIMRMKVSEDVIEMPGRRIEDDSTAIVSERIRITAALRGLEAGIVLLLGVDQGQIGDLQLGSLFHTDQILECFMSSVYEAKIAHLDVSIDDIGPPTLKSHSSHGLTRVMSSGLNAATEMYEQLVLNALPAFFDDSIAPMVNSIVQDYVRDSKRSGCSMPLDVAGVKTIDMRDLILRPEEAKEAGGLGTQPYGSLVSLGKAAMDEMLLTPNMNGSLPINDLIIAPLTRSQSGVEGTLQIPGDIINEAVEIDFEGIGAVIEISVSDISLENIDSIGSPIEILYPQLAHNVHNEAAIGAEAKPLRFSTVLRVVLSGEKQAMENELQIAFELSSAQLLAVFGVKMSESSLMHFPLRDVLNPWCWLATVPAPELNALGVSDSARDNEGVSLSLEDMLASVQQMKLDISCISCSSPDLERFSELSSSPDAINEATDALNMLLNYLANVLGGDLIQVQLDRLLNKAASKCPSDPFFGMDIPPFVAFATEELSDDSAAPFFAALSAIAGMLAVALTVGVLLVRFVVRQRHAKWLESLTTDEVGRLLAEQRYEKELGGFIATSTKSLAMSGSIPLAIRLILPIIIVANTALFLSGHLSLGGTVNIAFQAGGQDMSLDNFYDFSVAGTVVEMWKAGATEMAILIIIFSGVWPYSKQLATLVLFFSPPTWVSAKKRGQIFSWLDALGKYSMVDIFVLIVAMVAFRVSIDSPAYAFLPENLYSVDLILVALWGLYANMTAQVLSQLSSHVIIYYHDKVVQDALSSRIERESQATTSKDEEDSLERNSERDLDEPSPPSLSSLVGTANIKLRHHLFGLGDHKPSRLVRVKNGTNIAVVFVAITIAIVMGIGCVIPSFHFEIFGLVGVVIETGQEFDRAIGELYKRKLEAERIPKNCFCVFIFIRSNLFSPLCFVPISD